MVDDNLRYIHLELCYFVFFFSVLHSFSLKIMCRRWLKFCLVFIQICLSMIV